MGKCPNGRVMLQKNVWIIFFEKSKTPPPLTTTKKNPNYLVAYYDWHRRKKVWKYTHHILNVATSREWGQVEQVLDFLLFSRLWHVLFCNRKNTPPQKKSHLWKIKRRISFTSVLMGFLERTLIKDMSRKIKMIQALYICLLNKNSFSLQMTQA